MHLPFFMQGAVGFATPHGPWTMQRLTMSKSRGSETGSGHVARMIQSISAGVVGRVSGESERSMCI